MSALANLSALPAIVGECLIGFRHAVRVFLLLDGIAAIVRSVDQFARKFLFHRLLASSSRIGQQPADAQRSPAISADFNGHLVCGTANTSAFDFKDRLDVLNGLLE